MDLIKLEQKWGEMLHEEHYSYNCKLPFISDKALLNIVFDPLNMGETKDKFSQAFHCSMPLFLEEIYERCNGCRLFFSSLSIFGFQVYPKDVHEPFDILLENANNYAKMPEAIRQRTQLIFFATLGGAYIFGTNKDEQKKVYMLNCTDYKTEGIYPDFDSFFDTFFDMLYDEYDDHGRKIHPVSSDIGIPALENLTYTLL